MTAVEKQQTLQNLKIVTGIFQEFEQAYNIVVELEQDKRALRRELEVSQPVKAVAGLGSSVAATLIAYVILFLPSILIGWFVMAPRLGASMLLAFVINLAGAILLGKPINRMFRAGGSKVQNTINRRIQTVNEDIKAYNASVDEKIDLAQEKCDKVREKILQLDMSWYPPDYCCSDASSFFYKAIINGKCETLGEAVNLYDEQLYRDQTLANQKEQINLLYKQCILQAQTIAAIHSEGAATRKAIQAGAAAVSGAIWANGDATRDAIWANGEASRQQVAAIYKDFIDNY